MATELVTRTIERLMSGINYACSGCGMQLYHTGVDAAYESGREALQSKQPVEIAERLASCPNCGRRLSREADPATIKIEARGE